MKKLLILGGAAALVFSSCGTKGGNLKNVTDTLAYTMGMELGEYVKNMDSVMEMKFDLATVVAAMKDVAKGDTSVMTRQQAMDFIQEYYMVRKPRIDSAANADFLAQVEKDNKNVKKTESGLLYEIVREGEGAKPDSADNVFVTYKLSDRKGNVIEDRSAEGDTTKLNMARVIPGWVLSSLPCTASSRRSASSRLMPPSCGCSPESGRGLSLGSFRSPSPSGFRFGSLFGSRFGSSFRLFRSLSFFRSFWLF